MYMSVSTSRATSVHACANITTEHVPFIFLVLAVRMSVGALMPDNQ